MFVFNIDSKKEDGPEIRLGDFNNETVFRTG